MCKIGGLSFTRSKLIMSLKDLVSCLKNCHSIIFLGALVSSDVGTAKKPFQKATFCRLSTVIGTNTNSMEAAMGFFSLNIAVIKKLQQASEAMNGYRARLVISC